MLEEAHLEEKFGTHSMRKTFGYHHYKKYKDVAMLQKIFNHSSPAVTLTYIGIEQEEKYIRLGLKRKAEIEEKAKAEQIFKHMSENPNEVQVLVNHVRASILPTMIEKGITYMRAGDSKGSILVTPGFERIGYILLHTGGENCHLFKLRQQGCF